MKRNEGKELTSMQNQREQNEPGTLKPQVKNSQKYSVSRETL